MCNCCFDRSSNRGRTKEDYETVLPCDRIIEFIICYTCRSKLTFSGHLRAIPAVKSCLSVLLPKGSI